MLFKIFHEHNDRIKALVGIVSDWAIYPTLNAAYSFPFKRPLNDVKLSRFIEVEYDTGYILTWCQAKWREQVLDNGAQIGDSCDV